MPRQPTVHARLRLAGHQLPEPRRQMYPSSRQKRPGATHWVRPIHGMRIGLGPIVELKSIVPWDRFSRPSLRQLNTRRRWRAGRLAVRRSATLSLHGRVVPHVTGAAHAAGDDVVGQQPLELLARVLAVLVRAMQQRLRLAATPARPLGRLPMRGCRAMPRDGSLSAFANTIRTTRWTHCPFLS